MKNGILILLAMFSMVMFSGCLAKRGNIGELQSFAAPGKEPEWIRNGEPIEFEGDQWYPKDVVEVMMDSEVYLVAEFRKTQVFVDRIDVRPFDTLYTKFDVNKFRAYKKSE